MNTALRMLGLIGCALISASSCGGLGPACELQVELRWSADRSLGELPKMHLVTDDGASSTPIPMMETSSRDDWNYASDEFSVYRESRRVLVFDNDDGVAEVFELELPRSPKPTEWTAWTRPEYVEGSGWAWWNALHDQRHEERSSLIPADASELRYRVTSCEAG